MGASEELAFTGRTALITGAASGIGAATAQWLDAHGVGRLILVDLDQAGIEALALSCETQRVAGDVADPVLWQRLSETTSCLDHAVINAGIADGSPIVETDYEAWRRMIAVNLDGAFLALRFALRAMRGAHRGSVVLTASISGIKPQPNTAAYSASKAAVIQLGRVAALEAAALGVRVNVIAPGGVDSGIWDKAGFFASVVEQHGGRAEALAAMGRDSTPLGRFAASAEVAAQIGFLLSDMAATMTGSVLVADGGASL